MVADYKLISHNDAFIVDSKAVVVVLLFFLGTWDSLGQLYECAVWAILRSLRERDNSTFPCQSLLRPPLFCAKCIQRLKNQNSKLSSRLMMMDVTSEKKKRKFSFSTTISPGKRPSPAFCSHGHSRPTTIRAPPKKMSIWDMGDFMPIGPRCAGGRSRRTGLFR